MVDQEGGKVRRLKEKLGFAPLPSALAFNALPSSEKKRIAEASFQEMRALGFHYDLAPVIDLNYNPENPDIGKVERSFSANPNEVRANFKILNAAAENIGLGLCLKHFPGLGAARVNSHEELTDISGTLRDEQLALFYELGREIHGGGVLVSHGLVREWDPHFPVSMSEVAIARLRHELPDAILMSDDLQMQGLQKLLPSKEACLQGLRAGLDLIIIGNNLIAEDERCLEYARAVAQEAEKNTNFRSLCETAISRVRARKRTVCTFPKL
jgi:beta-N-acetylhexosaminidase